MSTIDFQQAIDDYIALRPPAEKYSQFTFRASGLKGCVRQCVRQRLGISVSTKESLRQMEIGTQLHRFMQRKVGIGHIGRPVEFEKAVLLDLGNNLSICGHIDCWDGETVYDFKTTADLDKTLDYPITKSYVYQVSAYALSVKASRAQIVYIDKRNLKVAARDIDILPLQTLADFCREVFKAENVHEQTQALPPKDGCYTCKVEDAE